MLSNEGSHEGKVCWLRHPLLCTPLGLSHSRAAGPSLSSASGHTPSGPCQPKPRHFPCPPFASQAGKALMYDLASDLTPR